MTKVNIDFGKAGGLVPAVIQDDKTGRVLMLGYMNEEAYAATRETGRVTFFSRTRGCLWTKGETSGNFLLATSILIDCDSDTLLVKARPTGPVCHTGSDTCFGEENGAVDITFLSHLQGVIEDRRQQMPDGSYTTTLFLKGVNRMAQKVGEEAVETVIEAVNGTVEGFVYEAADLVYHLMVLLAAKGLRVEDLCRELERRHKE
ncbi:MAG: bifunctional phosphoribosyl-AMP cyclohydrolase/phosphoribosyl-ATP diphosphatase HisIE [Tannerellaceae bacterium]|jgi:phosphoribosyl-ATP pyrophosphohydrolase/phosphoribosyl-AMP cyclohydrolase|nr:bifunctional phosphoribosyl-AMP cyclohydrolase/phosphoribosyl-ATP diphosphatase HisIE [Tannerellaceae bacterium]